MNVLRAAVRKVAARAARGYVAGPLLADARRTADTLTAKGYRVTVGYWDDATEAAEDIVACHHEALADMDRSGGDYVSVKAPSFGYDRAATLDLVADARRRGLGVHFDSLDHDTADPTLDLLRSLPGDGAGLGITVPGRWRRGPGDAIAHVEAGVTVRVVKGQWADPGEPDLDPAEGFLAVVSALAGVTMPVRIATHDEAVLGESLQILASAGTPAEAELLFGLPVHKALAVAMDHGVTVRIYVPYGHAWLPYALDGLKRDPRLLFRLAGDAVGGRYHRRFRDLTTV